MFIIIIKLCKQCTTRRSMPLSIQGKQYLYRPIRAVVSQQAITCTNHGTALIPTQLYLQLQSISKKGRQSPSIKGSTDYRLHQCEREGIEPPVLALVSRRESNLYPSCHWTEIAAAPPRVAQQPKGGSTPSRTHHHQRYGSQFSFELEIRAFAASSARQLSPSSRYYLRRFLLPYVRERCFLCAANCDVCLRRPLFCLPRFVFTVQLC